MRSTEGNWGISAEREDALNNCPVSSGRELYDVHLDLRAAVRAEYLVGAVPQFRGVSSGGLLGGPDVSVKPSTLSLSSERV